MSESTDEHEPGLFGSVRQRDKWWLKILIGFAVAALLHTGYWVAYIWLEARNRLPGDIVGRVVVALWCVVLLAIVLAWLRGRRSPEVFNRPNYLCPRCMGVFIGRHMRVVPMFDPSTDDYQLAYQCADCWPVTLQDTEIRLQGNVEWARERLKFVRCFERAGLLGLDASDETRLRAQAGSLFRAFKTSKLDVRLP